MSEPLNIAVLGASSLAGEALVELLDERGFPVGALHLLDTPETAGRAVAFAGKNLRIRPDDEFDFSQVELVFMARVPNEALLSTIMAAQCHLIDLSGAPAIPGSLPLVPEVNAGHLAGQSAPYRLRCPSSLAIALAVTLAPLGPLDRLVVTACVPVSSRGREGVSTLARQTAELLNARPLEPGLFGSQMAFNLLAQVEPVDGSGQGALEIRTRDDIRAVLGQPDLPVSITCLQVPVFYGDSLSVSLRSPKPLARGMAVAALESAEGIEFVEDESPSVVADAVGQDCVFVGRLRTGTADDCTTDLWIVSDNLRKGSALNAVQIGELLIKQYL